MDGGTIRSAARRPYSMEPQLPGFEFRYRIGRGAPTIVRLPFGCADRPTDGDMLSYSGGEVDVAVTGGAALLGTALGPDAVSESEHTVPVIINADAIYAVADPDARTEGATLDIVGATGRQGVAPSINADLVVVQDSAAGEKTLVRIKPEQWVPHHHKAGGPLNAAIARAVVHIHHDRIGRGPTKAQAFYRNEVVVVILQNAMTTSERTLVAAGKGEAVLATRRALEEVIRPDLVSAVEQLTGCKVKASLSAHNLEPDLAAELFVLDRPVTAAPEEHPEGPRDA